MGFSPRSLVAWVKVAIAGGDPLGRGGAMGTPSLRADEAPPSADQDTNRTVSGGGIVGPDDSPPEQHTPRGH
jgi:hypothetical protein